MRIHPFSRRQAAVAAPAAVSTEPVFDALADTETGVDTELLATAVARSHFRAAVRAMGDDELVVVTDAADAALVLVKHPHFAGMNPTLVLDDRKLVRRFESGPAREGIGPVVRVEERFAVAAVSGNAVRVATIVVRRRRNVKAVPVAWPENPYEVLALDAAAAAELVSASVTVGDWERSGGLLDVETVALRAVTSVKANGELRLNDGRTVRVPSEVAENVAAMLFASTSLDA